MPVPVSRARRLVDHRDDVAERYSLRRPRVVEGADKKSERQAKTAAAKKDPGAGRETRKCKVDARMKSVKKMATKRKAEKKTNKKIVKKRPARKTTGKKVGKKIAKRKLGGKKRSSAKKVAGKLVTPPMSDEATRLAIAVHEAEQALDQASTQLTEARGRVAGAAATARLKRTQAAHMVATRAREEVAQINERRLNVGIRLRDARDAIGKHHKADPDWHALEHALKGAIERYEEALRASDRRVNRTRGRRNR